jgi:adenylate kinase family enzyme
VRRVAIVGNSGSGKTSTGRALSTRLGVPHLELDSVQHLPGWQPRPTDEFRAVVAEQVAAEGWVVDGNYSKARDLIWGAADTIIWLDLPRRTVMRQVSTRTLRRMATREELWNGNREQFRTLLSRDPTESIILWAWTAHSRVRARYLEAMSDPQWHRLRFVRLCSRSEVDAFLARVGVPEDAAELPAG